MDTTTDTAEAISYPTTDHEATDQEASTPARSQPLCRPFHGRMLAGVAAGVADYLGVDVTIVRIVLAVLTIMGGAGVPLYLAGWLLIPDEGAEQSLASELIQSVSARSR
jgi:phage shock protein PspC (stress-responsive transcriptional regulator)